MAINKKKDVNLNRNQMLNQFEIYGILRFKRIVSLHDTLGNHILIFLMCASKIFYTLKNQKNHFKTTRDVVIKNVSYITFFIKNIKYEAFKTHERYIIIFILQMNIE